MSAQARLSVCLTFDFDATCVWIADTDNAGTISRGEFGPYVMPRILALLERHGIRATFFTPGHTALAYPRVVRAIQEAGHELAGHSWVHENPEPLGRDGEREVIERGLAALESVTGETVVGYRAPAGGFNSFTAELLHERGLLYDSSCMGADFTGYYLRRGDRWSKTEPYVFGEPIDLVELPWSWGLDDFPLMEFDPGFSTGQKSPSEVREIWQGEFDYAHAHEPGGLFVLCMHPQVIGRGSRLLMLEALIEHMAQLDGVAFEAMGDYATRWRADHPLQEWKAGDSVHVGHPAPAPWADQAGRDTTR